MKKLMDILCETIMLFIVSSLGYVSLVEIFKYPVVAIILIVSSTILTLKRYGYIDKLIDKVSKK